jgi:hypothetical protein
MEFLKRIFTCKNSSKEEKKENSEEANKIVRISDSRKALGNKLKKLMEFLTD